MGDILITTRGSFGPCCKKFSARANGHADAVARAIEYLAADLLPKGTAKDHKLHGQGIKPENGFNRATIYICGVTCHPGGENCNGYCDGKEDAPKALTD